MASDSVTLQFRGIAVEDFLTTNVTLAQISQTVLGVGSIPLSPLVVAANDTEAKALGVAQWSVYVNNSGSVLVLRTQATIP